MEKIASGWKARWKALYHRSGIQMILSIAFTAVAVVGMLFLGIALLLRFSSSANEVAAENSQRVLAQVNWSLDGYLRNMMRVSDTVYYRVIKNADLEQDGMAQELHDALELLYAKDRDVLVSLAVFDENGGLISATPLTELKKSVRPAARGGSPPPWSALRICIFPRPMCRTCLRIRIRGITGWSPSAAMWS